MKKAKQQPSKSNGAHPQATPHQVPQGKTREQIRSELLVFYMLDVVKRHQHRLGKGEGRSRTGPPNFSQKDNMRKLGTRLSNHPDRHPEDYKPWMSKQAVKAHVARLMEKGCVVCGATSSMGTAEFDNGVKTLVQHWCAVLTAEGAERLLCYQCLQAYFPDLDDLSQ